MDRPTPEAVRDALSWLRAALDCPTFSWDADQRDAAEVALTAAQQQGQAVACTCHYLSPQDCPHVPHRTEPDTRPNAQPMQQGGGEACTCAGNYGPDKDGHLNSCRAIQSGYRKAAPPSAPVGVDDMHDDLPTPDLLNEAERIAVNQFKDGRYSAARVLRILCHRLAQQPAAVDEAMVMVQKHDALILANFAKAHGGAMEQLAASRIASLATQHQEPTT